jgi:hypothetical protein
MKLFTLFTSDDRAVDHVRGQHAHIAAAVKRVANHDEWGVRVALDRAQASRVSARKTSKAAPATGVDYLTRKKARRDASVELAARARETVAALYDRLAERSKQSKRPASCRWKAVRCSSTRRFSCRGRARHRSRRS